MKKIAKALIAIQIATFISIQVCFPKSIEQEEIKTEITYIANEGFLIKVGDKSILIDAIFGDKEYSSYDTPDSAQIYAITKALNPFANIDLIAVTHNHIDHFYAPFAANHLGNNKVGKLISCKQVISKLTEIETYIKIEPQLIEITPDSLKSLDTVINGIDIKVLRLMHGPYYETDPETGKKINRHQNIQNLGFIFSINGVKIFHCGDSSPSCISDYEHFGLEKENIDIAFLGRGFMWEPNCQGMDVIRNYIKPKHIILMHIHHNQNERFIDVVDKVKDEFPSVTVFEKSMENKSFLIN